MGTVATGQKDSDGRKYRTGIGSDEAYWEQVIYTILKTLLKYNQANPCLKSVNKDFPGGPVVRNLSAGDMSSIPDLGRSHMLQSN